MRPDNLIFDSLGWWDCQNLFNDFSRAFCITYSLVLCSLRTRQMLSLEYYRVSGSLLCTSLLSGSLTINSGCLCNPKPQFFFSNTRRLLKAMKASLPLGLSLIFYTPPRTGKCFERRSCHWWSAHLSAVDFSSSGSSCLISSSPIPSIRFKNFFQQFFKSSWLEHWSATSYNILAGNRNIYITFENDSSGAYWPSFLWLAILSS